MKRYCMVCRSVHDGKCQRPKYYAPKASVTPKRISAADKFRSTQSWKRKAAGILERDFHCCRVCLKAGLLNNRELSVHHIIPLSADYEKRLDEDNLITLCRFHHEQAERGIISKRELLKLAAESVELPKL